MSRDEESQIAVEDDNLSELIKLSSDSYRKSFEQLCPNCAGKQRSPHEKLSRWSGDAFGGSLSGRWKALSSCHCKHETENAGKYEGSRLKKRFPTTDSMKAGKNQKDFISHNKQLCNLTRHKSTLKDQKMYQFVHYRNSKSYIEVYRRKKRENLERQDSFHQDQLSFDNELFTTLSKSLSNFMSDGVTTEHHPTCSHVDALAPNLQSQLKLDQKKCVSPILNSDPFAAQSKSKNLAFLDLCRMKCGDTINSKQIPQSVYQETNFAARAGNQEKSEEKKYKKVLKRASDPRPKLLAEKILSDLPKPVIEPATSCNMQPVCHQIPIRNNSTEKQASPRKEEWKGHPSGNKPVFSEKPRKRAEGRRLPNESIVGKSLEYADIFNTYGDKYHLIKETI